MALRFFSMLLCAFLIVGNGAAARAADTSPVPGSTVLVAGTIGGLHAYGCAVIVAATRDRITLVTAAHNMTIESPEYITTTGERLTVLSASTLEGHDLTMLVARAPRGAFAIATLASTPPVGGHVHVWGPIESEPFSAHEGVVREMDARITDAPQASFAIDCTRCDHGDSGTGVYDDDGHLVGIVTRGYYASGKKLLVLIEMYQPVANVAAK